MPRIRNLLLAGLMVVCASCTAQKSPKELIIGKWESIDGDVKTSVEFMKDGTAKATRGVLPMTGRYQWIDDQTLDMEVDNPLAGSSLGNIPGKELPKTVNFRSKVTVTKTELTTVDPDGKTVHFRRMK